MKKENIEVHYQIMIFYTDKYFEQNVNSKLNLCKIKEIITHDVQLYHIQTSLLETH